MEKKTVIRRSLSAAVFCLLAVALLSLAGTMLRPLHTSYGSTWDAYLAEPKDSVDVLFLGSSYAYCDFDPAAIEEYSGLKGYVMGGSEQTMSLTYWYLRQALETQSPRTVVIEPTGVFFEKYQNFTQTNLVYMPFSVNKLRAIFTAAEPELRTGLLWDLWFYHSRWKELKPSEVLQNLRPAVPDPYRGYTPLEGTEAEPCLDQSPRPVTEAQYKENLGWLLKCLELCEERGIRAVLLFNPTYGQCSPQQYAMLEADVAQAAPQALYYNWASEFETFGIDKSHYYDGGHFNQEGARLYAKAVAGLLTGLE